MITAALSVILFISIVPISVFVCAKYLILRQAGDDAWRQ